MRAKQNRSLIPPRSLADILEAAPANWPTTTRWSPSLPLPLAPGFLWQLGHSFIFVYFSCRGFCSISPKWDNYINKLHCIVCVMKSRVSGLLAEASGPVHKARLTHVLPTPQQSDPCALTSPLPSSNAILDFQDSSVVKNPGNGFYPWVGKIPWGRKWQPTPAFLPGKSHGQRSLTGYSPRGHESQTRLNNHHTSILPRDLTLACLVHTSISQSTDHRSYSSPSQNFQFSTTSTQSFHHLRLSDPSQIQNCQ